MEEELSLPPIIRYPGGKNKITKTLLSYTPKHRVFVEPFLGGGSYFFAKQPVEKMVINDIDKRLVDFYRNIRTMEAKDIEKCEAGSKSDFYELKNGNLNNDPAKNVCDLLFMNKCSYGGKMNNWGYLCNGKRIKGIEKLKNHLEQYKKKLRRAIILNQDFEKVIKRFDSPYSFTYCDPPYFKVGKEYYKFGVIDHEKLRDILKNAKGKWLLSYNDVPEIRKLYRGFHIKRVSFLYTLGSGHHKTKTELLIANYNLNDKSLGNPSPDDYLYREGITISKLDQEPNAIADLAGIGLIAAGFSGLANDNKPAGAISLIAGFGLLFLNRCE